MVFLISSILILIVCIAIAIGIISVISFYMPYIDKAAKVIQPFLNNFYKDINLVKIGLYILFAFFVILIIYQIIVIAKFRKMKNKD